MNSHCTTAAVFEKAREAISLENMICCLLFKQKCSGEAFYIHSVHLHVLLLTDGKRFASRNSELWNFVSGLTISYTHTGIFKFRHSYTNARYGQ